MTYNLTIASLIITMEFCDVSLCPTEDKQRFADTLDTLLKFPGWKQIKMRAKCWAPAGNETESFNGEDLVTKIDYKLDLNEEYEEDMENRIVIKQNVETKHYMTLQLLGCVYTDVLLRLFTFFKFPLEHCHWERRRHRLKDDTQKKSRGIFINMLQNMEKCQPMTEYMFTALDYVIGLVPVKDCENSLLIDVTKIATHTKSKVHQVFAGIRHHMKSLEIMSSNVSNEDDKVYKAKLGKYSGVVIKSIDNVMNGHLAEFKSKRCVEPAENDDASISKWLETLQEKCKKSNDEEFVGIIKNGVQQFVGETVETYYSNLGFVSRNEITTLSNTIPIE